MSEKKHTTPDDLRNAWSTVLEWLQDGRCKADPTLLARLQDVHAAVADLDVAPPAPAPEPEPPPEPEAPNEPADAPAYGKVDPLLEMAMLADKLAMGARIDPSNHELWKASIFLHYVADRRTGVFEKWNTKTVEPLQSANPASFGPPVTWRLEAKVFRNGVDRSLRELSEHGEQVATEEAVKVIRRLRTTPLICKETELPAFGPPTEAHVKAARLALLKAWGNGKPADSAARSILKALGCPSDKANNFKPDQS